ncbi:MAG: ABC transporter substrate-binding protein [bacterium]|nr:ABC transporter substrate-binding protein [bacterium]
MSWLTHRASNIKNGLRQPAPSVNEVRGVVSHLSKTKQILVAILTTVCIGSIVLTLLYVNNLFLVEVPAHGGELTEGVIGHPRLINPLFLAKNDAEIDIATLTYSGLMRVSKDGTLEPDLAESYTISDKGTVYTFVLRENLTWHDGEALTAKDILFTIQQVQDPLVKSPHRAKWEGVTVETPNGQTIVFTLSHPFSRFLENTTLGMLPEHIWGSIGVDEFALTKFNEEPIGSGPYRFVESNRDRAGIPTDYLFRAFKNFALGQPYIEKLTVRFYPSHENLRQALSQGDIDSAAALSADTAQALLTDRSVIISPTYPLPRVFSVFFNQDKQAIFTDVNVRRALSLAVPRQSLINQIFKGYATAITTALPPGILGGLLDETITAQTDASPFSDAEALLDSAGWKRSDDGIRQKKEQELAFTLVTANTQEFKDVTDALKAIWETLGARVTINLFEPNDLAENVIRPREYEALFFGQAIGRDPDPYSFWHSSGRNDPGLNVALYANITADDVLERARIETDETKRADLLRTFEEEIKEDVPAVFLYAPHLIYVVPEDLQGVSFGIINQASERFTQIHRWYRKTDRIWKVFIQ